MSSQFSPFDTVRHTPLRYRELPVPYLMWGNLPTRRQSSRVRPAMHPRLIGSGATLLIGAFATDLAFARSGLFQWENFSIWLITAGLIVAAAAAMALAFDAVSHRISSIDWLRLLGFTGAVLLSVLNAFVHSHDAYTAVVPQGAILSGIVAAILLTLGWWHGWSVGKDLQSRLAGSKELRP